MDKIKQTYNVQMPKESLYRRVIQTSYSTSNGRKKYKQNSGDLNMFQNKDQIYKQLKNIKQMEKSSDNYLSLNQHQSPELGQNLEPTQQVQEVSNDNIPQSRAGVGISSGTTIVRRSQPFFLSGKDASQIGSSLLNDQKSTTLITGDRTGLIFSDYKSNKQNQNQTSMNKSHVVIGFEPNLVLQNMKFSNQLEAFQDLFNDDLSALNVVQQSYSQNRSQYLLKNQRLKLLEGMRKKESNRFKPLDVEKRKNKIKSQIRDLYESQPVTHQGQRKRQILVSGTNDQSAANFSCSQSLEQFIQEQNRTPNPQNHILFDNEESKVQLKDKGIQTEKVKNSSQNHNLLKQSILKKELDKINKKVDEQEIEIQRLGSSHQLSDQNQTFSLAEKVKIEDKILKSHISALGELIHAIFEQDRFQCMNHKLAEVVKSHSMRFIKGFTEATSNISKLYKDNIKVIEVEYKNCKGVIDKLNNQLREAQDIILKNQDVNIDALLLTMDNKNITKKAFQLINNLNEVLKQDYSSQRSMFDEYNREFTEAEQDLMERFRYIEKIQDPDEKRSRQSQLLSTIQPSQVCRTLREIHALFSLINKSSLEKKKDETKRADWLANEERKQLEVLAEIESDVRKRMEGIQKNTALKVLNRFCKGFNNSQEQETQTDQPKEFRKYNERKQQLKQIKRQMEGNQLQMDTIQKSIKGYIEKIFKSQQEADRAHKELTEAEKQVDKIEKECHAAEKRAQELQHKTQKYEQQVEKLEQEKFKYEDMYKSAVKRLQNKQKEYDQLIKEKEDEEAELQKKIDALNGENKSVKEMLVKANLERQDNLYKKFAPTKSGKSGQSKRSKGGDGFLNPNSRKGSGDESMIEESKDSYEEDDLHYGSRSRKNSNVKGMKSQRSNANKTKGDGHSKKQSDDSKAFIKIQQSQDQLRSISLEDKSRDVVNEDDEVLRVNLQTKNLNTTTNQQAENFESDSQKAKEALRDAQFRHSFQVPSSQNEFDYSLSKGMNQTTYDFEKIFSTGFKDLVKNSKGFTQFDDISEHLLHHCKCGPNCAYLARAGSKSPPKGKQRKLLEVKKQHLSLIQQ